ncbi:MAG: zinc ribbon domain-containing protein [Anaerolineales bacterium]|nr:zinc ribbon domain-containing protein [Anaerolineales bacterium]
MPLYEYVCMDCKTTFDVLRSMSQADDPIECAACQSKRTSRKISLFYARSDGRSVAGTASGCSSCSTSSCSSCSVAH